MKTLLAKIWKALRLPKNFQLFIMRLTQDQFLIGATGIIFNEDDQILLFKHTYRQHSWSLPGGYVKSKEHPGEGLEREIKEESNFTISADEQMMLRTDRDSGRIDVCYTGKFLGGDFQPCAEVTEAGFFSFDNLPLLPKSQLLLIREALDKKEERIAKKLKEEEFTRKLRQQQLAQVPKPKKLPIIERLKGVFK